ncbi:hypothetical protein Tco_0399922 [Tanacetum coccineum]
MNGNRNEWEDKLDDALLAFRVAYKSPIGNAAGKHRFLQLNELAKLRNKAYEHSRAYKERVKRWHDAKIMDKEFHEGVDVLPYGTIEVCGSTAKELNLRFDLVSPFIRQTAELKITKVMEFADDGVFGLDEEKELAKLLKENVFILDPDGALMSTQEYMQKVVEDVDEEANFNSGAWVSATNYVNAFGGTVTGCLGDIDNFLKMRKLEQVVVIVKSCSSNALGDLNVILKDLSVFTPKPSKHYLNITVGAAKDTVSLA